MAHSSWGQLREIHSASIVLKRALAPAAIVLFISLTICPSAVTLNTQQTASWFHCPPGWTVTNDHCYKLTAAKLTWTQAEAYCNSQGGNLASVTSQTKQNFVSEFVNGLLNLNDKGSLDIIWIENSPMPWNNYTPRHQDFRTSRLRDFEQMRPQCQDLPLVVTIQTLTILVIIPKVGTGRLLKKRHCTYHLALTPVLVNKRGRHTDVWRITLRYWQKLPS
ncbi:hypothetical protein Btru_025086 [Bulinus truncatus]|nr:hypothetical protein Btru_025086 [Bulinus truncatus]